MSLSRSARHIKSPKVEINIVPLVDVALVLLIIFMVTATFVKTAGIDIKLPSSTATSETGKAKRELVVGVRADGGFVWQGVLVTDGQLAASLAKEASTFGVQSKVIVQGDVRAAHGRVVDGMSLAQEAGFSRLVISTTGGNRNADHR